MDYPTNSHTFLLYSAITAEVTNKADNARAAASTIDFFIIQFLSSSFLFF